jgi:hypothetical protein
MSVDIDGEGCAAFWQAIENHKAGGFRPCIMVFMNEDGHARIASRYDVEDPQALLASSVVSIRPTKSKPSMYAHCCFPIRTIGFATHLLIGYAQRPWRVGRGADRPQAHEGSSALMSRHDPRARTASIGSLLIASLFTDPAPLPMPHMEDVYAGAANLEEHTVATAPPAMEQLANLVI